MCRRNKRSFSICIFKSPLQEGTGHWTANHCTALTLLCSWLHPASVPSGSNEQHQIRNPVSSSPCWSLLSLGTYFRRLGCWIPAVSHGAPAPRSQQLILQRGAEGSPGTTVQCSEQPNYAMLWHCRKWLFPSFCHARFQPCPRHVWERWLQNGSLLCSSHRSPPPPLQTHVGPFPPVPEAPCFG